MRQHNTIYKFSIKLSFIIVSSCLFVSVALICFVLYLRKIVLLKICILYCLVSLNSVLFLTLFVSIHFKMPAVLLVLGIWCNGDSGMYYPVCEMVQLKLKQVTHKVEEAGFLSQYQNGPSPYTLDAK